MEEGKTLQERGAGSRVRWKYVILPCRLPYGGQTHFCIEYLEPVLPEMRV